jgi:hypothetical protein
LPVRTGIVSVADGGAVGPVVLGGVGPGVGICWQSGLSVEGEFDGPEVGEYVGSAVPTGSEGDSFVGGEVAKRVVGLACGGATVGSLGFT